MCSVAVYFVQIEDREGGKCEEVPNSEIVIARTAFRDNTSYYTINGRRVLFKEVSKLLKQHGVDLDQNRFLILQGEVESIAMMKSKGQSANECGMLEYLEDIVGTARYKEPLNKINDRVDKLTEERTEKHNRCKLAEREMKDLEQPYSEAIDYMKLENTLARTKNLQIQKYLSEQNKKLLEFATDREIITTEISEHDKVYEELKKQRMEKEAVIKKEIAQFDIMCKKKEEMEQMLKDSLAKFTEVQMTMTKTNERRKESHQQLKTNTSKLEELKKIPIKNRIEISDCEKKVEKLTKQKAEQEETLEKNYAILESQTKPLVDKREVLETNLLGLKENVFKSKAELSLAETELKILKQEEIAEKRKYETLKSSYEESKSSFDEKKVSLNTIISVIPKIKSDIVSKMKELQDHKNEENIMREKLITLEADISEKIGTMVSAQYKNRVLDALMKEKIDGRIPGILGRLGDLGGIDAKYDVAISTACHNIDHIVVDTVNTAQLCIDHLKRNDIGRGSFIALEKLKYLQKYCNSRIHTPENVPRLFDLIRVEDNRVLPAFYLGLHDTLVANDLDQGSRIAYGATRLRVVTLQGHLLEMSGTMSGGGNTQMRGKMGQNVRTSTALSANIPITSRKDVEQLQITAEKMQSRINYLQEEQSRLEKEIYQLKTCLGQKEIESKKLSITLESLSVQLPRIEEQLKVQTVRADKTKADPQRVKSLEDKIKERKDTFDQSEKAANKISVKVKDINDKIASIHGDNIKSVQRKIDGLTNQINKLNSNISKLKVEITTSERNYKKTEEDVKRIKDEITESENMLRTLFDDRTKYDLEAVDFTKKIEEEKEKLENATKGSSHLQKEIISIQKKESDGKLQRIEIEQKLQTLDKKISDVKEQLPHWQNKLKPLKLQEIPGETEQQEPLKVYTEEELNTYKLQNLQYKFSVQEEKKLNMKKPNFMVIQEYLTKREVYLERVKILEDTTNIRNEMRQLYDDVRKKRYTEFMQGFHIIAKKVKEMYQMITQGGDAELELVDSMDPFTEGVSFSVRPPKKTWKNISNLSGGEKTLSSLALVFALHYYKPSPLYFLDEIDAALDFKNISIVAHYIKEQTKNAQFIIISLRSNMFELSDYLVGIYKVQDCTNTITIKNTPPNTQ